MSEDISLTNESGDSSASSNDHHSVIMLTVKEVAERLRVSRTCVYQLVERGKLACHRIGLGRGAIRVTSQDLTTFIESCRDAREAVTNSPQPPVRLKHLKQ